MDCTPAEKLQRIIKYETEEDNFVFRNWFLKQFDGSDGNGISLEEFAVYFLNNLRQYAVIHLKTPSGNETPKCQTPARTLKSNNNADELVTPRRLMMDLHISDTSASNDHLNSKNCSSKNTSCMEFGSHSSPRLSTSSDRLGLAHNKSTSTPIKRNASKNSRKLSTTPTSSNKNSSSTLCLGDFLVFNTPTNNRSQKKKITPTANQQSSQKLQTDKPKKRVQPISVGQKKEKSNNSSSIFGGQSSFSSENNILQISNTELEDKTQCAILAARKSLAMNASEITKEIKNDAIPQMPDVAATITTSTPLKEIIPVETPLDLKKLENNLSLRRLADVYTLIIDLNLTTNILNELSFILNLLDATTANTAVDEPTNCQLDQMDVQHHDSNETCFSMLEKLPNAVYFALLCLENEKLTLGSLDAKSLGVVLINERFSYLKDDVKTYLAELYQFKQQIAAENPLYQTSLLVDTKTCNNVYFQHEQDSRDHFSSHQEFVNFRAQRDLFYNCLKTWEVNHLNPSWKFSSEIKPKIREMFNLSENCINMAHLAKLFVSQLLLSASNASSPEEMGLDVDLQKFSKLTQRLIAPSQFSVDYQFPRAEAFFRYFILQARSLIFAEQLKMELYAQLSIQNDSSLDLVNISVAENDADEQNASLADSSVIFVVKPDILNSMLILAKFLGLTISLPYNNISSNAVPPQVAKNQVRLRSLMQPTFDVYVLLQQAIEQGKLLIAIPWLVQYFAMLDNITLQIENYMRSLKLLFAVYTHIGLENPNTCTSSMFIIKVCLGWLFESKQFLAEKYYNYRAMLKGITTPEVENEYDFVKSKLKCDLPPHTDHNGLAINPYLESILPIACPFLAEFRVSIMPTKYAHTKNASRTGRYRHITTRLAELPSNTVVKTDENSAHVNQNSIQNSLIQAFLHSQNASTRQIIKFCTERCYKSTVKDGQLKIVLPAKTNADNYVNSITSFEYQFVFSSIKTIYDDAYAQVKAEWKDMIPKILHRRISNALESLLPEEISSVLKRTYLMIIEKEAAMKISQWFFANITTDNYFCPNLKDVANKICSANKDKVQVGRNQLTITLETPCLSDLIDELQYWLHCTSIRADRFKDAKPLIALLQNLTKSFENELPSLLYQLLGAGTLQLLQHIIMKHHCQLTDALIEAACQVWLHPNMLKALDSCSSNNICIYDAFLTVAFLESLGSKKEAFNRLGHLIITMIRKEVITVNYVNEMFVSIFKHDWQANALNEISNMLQSIAKETSDVPRKSRCSNSINNENGNESDSEDENGKSNLFMEMLADLSRDVDFF